MKINAEILKEIENYTTSLILNESSENLVYHTVEHTRQVAKNSVIIGSNENLTEDEMNILLASAWFHDTGYIKKYDGHEEESAAIAVSFLEQKDIDKDTIDLVTSCIIATTYPQRATNKLAKILCDADLMHLGMPSYFESAESLRQELRNCGIRKLKKIDFDEESVKFFNDHSYYTKYCLGKIATEKEKNLDFINQSYIRRKRKKDLITTNSRRFSRGVDTMFKLTARNQINLSSIADNKSNILISLNGIIISFGLVALASRFQENPAIIIPTVIFIVFSLSTIILAILATRPQVSPGKYSPVDIEEKKVNLLFFGNFYKMKEEEYKWAISEMISDDQYLYNTLTKDQYSLGKVLAQKYQLLRWAYSVFMVGLVVSVIAFLSVLL